MSIHHGLRAAVGASPSDPYFSSTVLLLSGNGSNGGQNNTFIDSSSNNFSITRNGNTTQGTFSPFSAPDGRWSNYFDGDGDYLSISNNSALQLGSGDYTVEAWVWLERITNTYNSNICGTLAFTGSDVGWSLGISTTGYPNFMSFNTGSGGFVITSSSTIPANRWVHLAAVRSGTSVKLYMDGVQVASGTSSLNETYTGAFAVGSNYVNFLSPNTGNSQVSIKGYISNVRVIKGSAQYTSAFTPSVSPLTAITNTSLLTCQSNRFKDNSSNAFSITPYGNAAVTSFSPFAPTAEYSASTNGGSGYFDGSGDALSLPINSSALYLSNSDFSFNCWVYWTASAAAASLLAGQQDSATISGSSYGFSIGTSTSIEFYSGSGTNYSITSPNPPLNEWSHIVVARTGGTLSSYLNGTRVSTRSDLGTSSNNNGTTYAPSIGRHPNGSSNPLTGYLSNLRLVKGSGGYDATATTLTVPTAPLTAITNTQLLLNFTNASILDSTARNDLETVGDAQISTSTKKYGTGSIYFDGTGDNLAVPSSANLSIGTGSFTLEGWIYPTSFSTAKALFSFANNNVFYFNTSGIPYYGIFGSTDTAIGTTAVTTSVWTHVAFVRNGSTLTCYLNGSSVGTATTSSSIGNSTDASFVGGHRSANYFNGYIDDLRITKGVARYTSNFTPPSAQLPAR